jgi:hypothetical protein
VAPAIVDRAFLAIGIVDAAHGTADLQLPDIWIFANFDSRPCQTSVVIIIIGAVADAVALSLARFEGACQREATEADQHEEA